jgi:hypothetical protein
MSKRLGEVLTKISEEYQGNISEKARNYVEVDIGEEAGKLGYTDLKEKYLKVGAIVPLRKALGGMKVRIDGRTFIRYAQFASGTAVPEYVAKEAGLPYETYVPNDSMILNFN